MTFLFFSPTIYICSAMISGVSSNVIGMDGYIDGNNGNQYNLILFNNNNNNNSKSEKKLCRWGDASQ